MDMMARDDISRAICPSILFCSLHVFGLYKYVHSTILYEVFLEVKLQLLSALFSSDSGVAVAISSITVH